MNTTLTTLARAAALTACLVSSAAWADAHGRITTSFDPGWRFLKGDAKGAEQPGFKDAKWRKLAVPHDWSIEGPYDQSEPTGRGGGYLPSGAGWYRKTFTVPASEAKRRVRIEFDGVMANSDVWINGHHLGKRPYGYASFSYDLTPHLKFGQPNVIAVRADNTVQPASRYYTGAGIYRHVRLVSTEPVQFGPGGVFVSTPTIDGERATVRIQSDLKNTSSKAGEFTVQTVIIDPDGKTVQTVESRQQVGAGQSANAVQEAQLAAIQRWNLDAPRLYKAVTTLRGADGVLDEQTTTFGIREARFVAETGFWLNGVNLKIKGVCLHHDAGALGAAVPLAAWERRFKLLKQAGVNAIRTSHNPVAPEFLDLADRMGFMVMDETFDTWEEPKHNGEEGYNRFWKTWWERDTRDMVIRDRNHPSIIIYSVGNEIHDNLNNPEGFQKYRQQQDLVHQLDPTRPVTMALFRPTLSKVYENGFVEIMDIVGQNYRENELAAAYRANPKRKVLGTENGHTQASWLAMRDNPFMSGQFLWVGFDYLGEADWPNTTFDQGLFDRAGNWKPRGYQRASWWSAKPMVKILRHQDNAGVGPLVDNWTPTDFYTYDDARIEVYSNAEEVELFLNDQSQGVKQKPADDSPRRWNVTFAKGTLRAVARNRGKEVAVDEMKTADRPARVQVASERPALTTHFDDVAFVTLNLVDAKGVLAPNATNAIKLTVTGPGEIAGVDNGSPMSHEPYQADVCKAIAGKCLAVIRAKGGGGKITVKAESKGLEAGIVTIDTQ
ncbi:MAG: glycoside hydrolase family 2 TIM barrel-domain containing protein [Gammaproteobacteria bacterium]